MNKTEAKKEIKIIIQDLERCKVDIENEGAWIDKVKTSFFELESLLSEKDVEIGIDIDEILSETLMGLKRLYLSEVVEQLESFKDETNYEITEASERMQEKMEYHYENLEDIIEQLQPESPDTSFEELISNIDSCLEDLDAMTGPYNN